MYTEQATLILIEHTKKQIEGTLTKENSRSLALQTLDLIRTMLCDENLPQEDTITLLLSPKSLQNMIVTYVHGKD